VHLPMTSPLLCSLRTSTSSGIGAPAISQSQSMPLTISFCPPGTWRAWDIWCSGKATGAAGPSFRHPGWPKPLLPSLPPRRCIRLEQPGATLGMATCGGYWRSLQTRRCTALTWRGVCMASTFLSCLSAR